MSVRTKTILVCLGEVGDWLNHFDVDQSKEYDRMIDERLAKGIPPFNFGISREDQEYLYQFEEQKKKKTTTTETVK